CRRATVPVAEYRHVAGAGNGGDHASRRNPPHLVAEEVGDQEATIGCGCDAHRRVELCGGRRSAAAGAALDAGARDGGDGPGGGPTAPPRGDLVTDQEPTVR